MSFKQSNLLAAITTAALLVSASTSALADTPQQTVKKLERAAEKYSRAVKEDPALESGAGEQFAKLGKSVGNSYAKKYIEKYSSKEDAHHAIENDPDLGSGVFNDESLIKDSHSEAVNPTDSKEKPGDPRAK